MLRCGAGQQGVISTKDKRNGGEWNNIAAGRKVTVKANRMNVLVVVTASATAVMAATEVALVVDSSFIGEGEAFPELVRRSVQKTNNL